MITQAKGGNSQWVVACHRAPANLTQPFPARMSGGGRWASSRSGSLCRERAWPALCRITKHALHTGGHALAQLSKAQVGLDN
jgi:hypothetical protein